MISDNYERSGAMGWLNGIGVVCCLNRLQFLVAAAASVLALPVSLQPSVSWCRKCSFASSVLGGKRPSFAKKWGRTWTAGPRSVEGRHGGQCILIRSQAIWSSQCVFEQTSWLDLDNVVELNPCRTPRIHSGLSNLHFTSVSDKSACLSILVQYMGELKHADSLVRLGI